MLSDALKACVDSIHFPSRERERAVTERAAKPNFPRAASVKVKRKGLEVRARDGFVGIEDKPLRPPTKPPSSNSFEL